VNSRQSEKGPDSSANNSSDKSGSLTLPTTSEDSGTEVEKPETIISKPVVSDKEELEDEEECNSNGEQLQAGCEVVETNDNHVCSLCECQCCTQPNVANQPYDISRSGVFVLQNLG